MRDIGKEEHKLKDGFTISSGAQTDSDVIHGQDSSGQVNAASILPTPVKSSQAPAKGLITSGE